MAITPQAIKDQEFQVKLRGYDTVEVKAYLELIAEEFFELLEQVRQQIDELDIIVEERDSLASEKKELEEQLSSAQGNSQEIQTEFAERDSEISRLEGEIRNLKGEISALEKERDSHGRELAEVKDTVDRKEKDFIDEKERTSRLLDKIEHLEKQNEELRGEELDFKSTLIAAQKFTNDLKKKSEQESREIIEKARSEADQLRKETYEELASYPAEIERLKQRRNKVRDELEAVLKLTLENLDIFKDEEPQEDYGELYQKIKFDTNGLINTDDLDKLDMDLELPSSSKESDSEEVFSMKEEMKKLGGDLG